MLSLSSTSSFNGEAFSRETPSYALRHSSEQVAIASCKSTPHSLRVLSSCHGISCLDIGPSSLELAGSVFRACVYAFQPLARGFGDSRRNRPSRSTVDVDLDELSHSPDLVDALFEEPDLEGGTGLAQLVDAQSQLGHGRVANRAEEVTVRVNNEAVLWRCRRIEVAVLNQIGIKNRVVAMM